MDSVRAAARHFPTPPQWFLQQAACIHRWEVGLGAYSDAAAWPLRWDDVDNPAYRGGLQFGYGTWASVGGVGDPALATRQEQSYRAWLVYSRDGGSWRQWTTAPLCGL